MSLMLNSVSMLRPTLFSFQHSLVPCHVAESKLSTGIGQLFWMLKASAYLCFGPALLPMLVVHHTCPIAASNRLHTLVSLSGGFHDSLPIPFNACRSIPSTP